MFYKNEICKQVDSVAYVILFGEVSFLNDFKESATRRRLSKLIQEQELSENEEKPESDVTFEKLLQSKEVGSCG